jgi:hypothetical protein
LSEAVEEAALGPVEVEPGLAAAATVEEEVEVEVFLLHQ